MRYIRAKGVFLGSMPFFIYGIRHFLPALDLGLSKTRLLFFIKMGKFANISLYYDKSNFEKAMPPNLDS